MIWEYKTLTLPSSSERQKMLSEMGLSGWELIGFEQGLAYFKRPIGEPDEVLGGITVPAQSAHQSALASKKDGTRIVADVLETRTIGSKKK